MGQVLIQRGSGGSASADQLPAVLARPTVSQTLAAGEYAMVGVPMTWDAGIGLTMAAGAALEARVPYVPPLVLAAPGGRATLTTLVPVTTTDVLAATTIYYTPYVSDWLPLYTAAGGWQNRQFTERSIAVPAVASQMYDVFGFWSEGATGLTLELLAWTNDTTRATGLTLTNGLQTKTGDQTRLYLGSFRTTSVAGQTEDSFRGTSQLGGRRFVWNMYNPVERHIGVIDTTATWVYGTDTYRQANSNTGNKVEVIFGLQRLAKGRVDAANNGTNYCSVGIGIDSTTVTSSLTCNVVSTGANGISSAYRGYPSVGYHAFNWLERSLGAGVTWYGNPSTTVQSGMQMEVLA